MQPDALQHLNQPPAHYRPGSVSHARNSPYPGQVGMRFASTSRQMARSMPPTSDVPTMAPSKISRSYDGAAAALAGEPEPHGLDDARSLPRRARLQSPVELLGEGFGQDDDVEMRDDDRHALRHRRDASVDVDNARAAERQRHAKIMQERAAYQTDLSAIMGEQIAEQLF